MPIMSLNEFEDRANDYLLDSILESTEYDNFYDNYDCL